MGGLGGLGAVVGEHSLGPFLSSVLPALAKPIINTATHSEGIKAAIDYSVAVVKGDKLINNVTKSLFRTGEVLPEHLLPSEESRNRLDKGLKDIQVNPQNASKIGGATAHYLPQHGVSIASTSISAANFLNSIRPGSPIHNPLDSTLPTSKDAVAKYNRALDIAQQPLVTIKSIKDGNLKSSDVVALNAMYPSLYAKLKQAVVQQMTEARAGGRDIPYAQRMSLSLFLAQPMDRTLTPMSILAAQPVPKQAPGNGQQPAAPVKHSTASLNKLASNYQTPGQSAEQRRTKVS
jgi:hypothetical protein